MAINIYTRTYTPTPCDKGEILRYAGVRTKDGVSEELSELIEQSIRELEDKLCYKICFCELPVLRCEGEMDLGFARVSSRSLEKNLSGCDSVIIFAATVGIELDRLIARHSLTSPTRALVLDAIGAERIESLCDSFFADIKNEKAATGRCVRPRFSPGYGDLPLELQRNIFDTLSCHKRIGVSLNESMLMSPSKSVTAIIGVANKEK